MPFVAHHLARLFPLAWFLRYLTCPIFQKFVTKERLKSRSFWVTKCGMDCDPWYLCRSLWFIICLLLGEISLLFYCFFTQTISLVLWFYFSVFRLTWGEIGLAVFKPWCEVTRLSWLPMTLLFILFARDINYLFYY